MSNLAVDNINPIWALRSLTKAEKIWQLASKIGVKGRDGDDVYIPKINAMESRDKMVHGKKETIASK